MQRDLYFLILTRLGRTDEQLVGGDVIGWFKLLINSLNTKKSVTWIHDTISARARNIQYAFMNVHCFSKNNNKLITDRLMGLSVNVQNYTLSSTHAFSF